ncbi:MAG: LysR family transcriptional regulator [Pseudomonadota bacterium]
MDLRSVEYLLMLDEERNITRAAERLGLSQSALSSFLMNLEKEIESTLYVRRRNVLIPTGTGEIYIDSVKQMANIKMHTYQAIQSMNNSVVEKISIGASPSRGSQIIMEIYPEIVKRFPHLKMEILEGHAESLRKKILDNEVDIVLSGISSLSDDRFSFIKMNREEILLTAHESFPLTSRGVTTQGYHFPVLRPSDVYDTPLVLMSKGTAIRELSDTILETIDFEPTIVCESEDIRFVCSLIQGGAGAGFVPVHFLQGMRNIRAFSLESPCFMDMGVLYMRTKKLNPVERFVISLIFKLESRTSDDSLPLSGEMRQLLHEFERL